MTLKNTLALKNGEMMMFFSALDVQLALHNLKCGIAARSDGLTAEHLKYGGTRMIEVIV